MARKNRENKVDERKRTFSRGMTALVLFSIVFLIVSAVFSYTSLVRHGSQIFADHQDVPVPDFKGMHSRLVQEDERYKGFRITYEEEYNSDVAKGVVFDQVPAAPKVVKDNARITLYVSKGPRIVAVPDIIGLTYGEAMKQLQELQLVVTRKTDSSGEKEQNTITAVEPDVGTALQAGSNITIYVSSPVNRVTTKVPKVIGMDFSTAKATLNSYGLRVGSVSEVFDDTKAPGTVLTQSVAANSSVRTGTTVNLTITYGLEIFERSFRLEMPYMDASKNKKYKVIIYKEDGKEKIGTFGDVTGNGLTLKRKGSVDEVIKIKIGSKWFRTIKLDYQNNTQTIIEDFSASNGFTLDAPEFPITLTHNEGGTVTGPSTATEGKNVTITIKCLPGYHISQVLDNNFDVTSSVVGGKYVIKNVITFHEVHVFFERDEMVPGPIGGGDGNNRFTAG